MIVILAAPIGAKHGADELEDLRVGCRRWQGWGVHGSLHRAAGDGERPPRINGDAKKADPGGISPL